MAYYGHSPLFAHSSCDSFYGLFWLHLPAGLLHLSGFYKLLVTSSEEVLHQFLWTLSTCSPHPSALLGLHTSSLAVTIALSLSQFLQRLKSLVSLSSPGRPCTTSLGARISQMLDIWSSSDGHLLITYGFEALWSSCDSHHSSSIYQIHTLCAFRWLARGGHKDASRSCCSLGSEFSFHQAVSIIPIR